jgi:virulence-associated protein VapD
MNSYKKLGKELWYLSIDLDTKNKNFKRSDYSTIKKYLVNLGFKWLKESNYVSTKQFNEVQILKIERDFVKLFPRITSVLTKFDWAVWNPDATSHSVNRMMSYRREKE